VLGDIGKPDLIGGLGAELTLHEVVVHRWPGSTIQSSLLGEDRPDALLGTQPRDTILPSSDPAPGKFVGDESVAEDGVIGMDVAGGVDQVRIAPITLRQRCFAPVENPSTRQVTVTGTPSAARSRTSGYICNSGGWPEAGWQC
jgi:hypothetical protein